MYLCDISNVHYEPYLTLPYLTFGANDTLRHRSVLRPSGGSIAHPHKAKGKRSPPKA